MFHDSSKKKTKQTKTNKKNKVPGQIVLENPAHSVLLLEIHGAY